MPTTRLCAIYLLRGVVTHWFGGREKLLEDNEKRISEIYYYDRDVELKYEG